MMKKILYTIAAGAMLLGGCSKESDTPATDSSAVKFSTEIATRASGTTWDNGDAIGVFMLTAGGTMPDNIVGNGMPDAADNVKYTTNGTILTGTPIYYPLSGNVDFVAYYPYRSSLSSYTYKVDVATQTTPAAIDLLYSNNAVNKAKSKSAVALEFDHKLSRMVLNIKAGIAITDTDLAGVTVKITGMPTTANFKLADGTFSNEAGTATAITPRTATAGTAYDAIVIPQAANSYTGRKMVFTVGTDVYEHPIPDADDFASGKNYPYAITVSKTGISVSQGTITDWTGTTDTPGDLGEVSQLPIQMVHIPAGTFLMGSPDSDTDAYNREKPQHWVKLTQDFYMSKYQITNAQYAAFLNAEGIDHEGKGSVTYYKTDFTNPVTERHDFIDDHSMGLKWETDKWIVQTSGYYNHPVIYVTWFGAKAYADWVGGSLPTEAQWEYACRAGTTTIYSYGDVADGDYMWYTSNSSSVTHEVGTKKANPWGLYDMHGNVWEWCSDWYDWYDDYGSTAATDPTGPGAGSRRVLRGGSWYSFAPYCRSAHRVSNLPSNRVIDVGFRVVFVP